jgi:hypothetical protein
MTEFDGRGWEGNAWLSRMEITSRSSSNFPMHTATGVCEGRDWNEDTSEEYSVTVRGPTHAMEIG